jgi:hypothetical protein
MDELKLFVGHNTSRWKGTTILVLFAFVWLSSTLALHVFRKSPVSSRQAPGACRGSSSWRGLTKVTRDLVPVRWSAQFIINSFRACGITAVRFHCCSPSGVRIREMFLYTLRLVTSCPFALKVSKIRVGVKLASRLNQDFTVYSFETGTFVRAKSFFFVF